MGQILIPGGGNSADLDMITATPGDVLAPKVTVDREGEPVTGTLALTGDTAAADVRRGKTFYSTDAKSRQTGTMAEKGAATYTPGRSNQVIAANQFLAGAQTIRGDANLLAQYIKKGVTIFGVMGSFEGYVPAPTDLYLRGNNIARFVCTDSSFRFDAGSIELQNNRGSAFAYSEATYNTTPFTKLNIELRNFTLSNSMYTDKSHISLTSKSLIDEKVRVVVGNSYRNFSGVFSFNIADINIITNIGIRFMAVFENRWEYSTISGTIYRIWFS